MNKKNKIKIKINKKYQEKMENESSKAIDTDKTEISTLSNNPKQEDFSWSKGKDKDNNLIKNYKRFPFEEWLSNSGINSIIFNPKKIYQDSSNIILQNDIFKDQQYYSEYNSKKEDIFPTFLKKKGIKYNKFIFDSIKPDFIVSDISKPDFIKIFNIRDYMFKYDQIYNKLGDHIDKINIIGEFKLDPDHIKSDQKNRYLNFCEYCNTLYKNNEYFLVLYIFDLSYKKFYDKNLHKDKAVILGYIPKLYKDDYLKVYNELKNNDDNNKNENNIDNENQIITSNDNNSKEESKKENQNNNNNINEVLSNTNKDKEMDGKINLNNDDNVSNNTNKDNKLEEKKDYNNMTPKELIDIIRDKEDLIKKKERDLEDQKICFEEVNNRLKQEKYKQIREIEKNILLVERSQEDFLLKKKREIENEEMEFSELQKLYNKKKKLYKLKRLF